MNNTHTPCKECAHIHKKQWDEGGHTNYMAGSNMVWFILLEFWLPGSFQNNLDKTLMFAKHWSAMKWKQYTGQENKWLPHKNWWVL